jgi:transposase-like protein
MVWKRPRLFRRARACRNLSHACREFGVSRKTFYNWRRRPQAAAGGDRPQDLRGHPLGERL